MGEIALFLLAISSIHCVSSTLQQKNTERCIASDEKCSKLFAKDVIDRNVFESNRRYIYKVMGSLNLKAPQVGNVINLGVLGAYLEKPVPTSELNKDPPEEEIESQYQAMLRAHEAYGINVKVSKERIVINALAFRDVLKFKLVKLIKELDPDFAHQNRSTNGDNLIDLFFFQTNLSVYYKATEIGSRISKVFRSPEMIEITKNYRDIFRNNYRNKKGKIFNTLTVSVIDKMRQILKIEMGEEQEFLRLCPLIAGGQ